MTVLWSTNSYSLQISEFSDARNMLIDFDDDNLVDLVTSQQDDQLHIYFSEAGVNKKIILEREKNFFKKKFFD